MKLKASYRHCWKLAKRTGKNFYYSFVTLPREKHMAMCAIYAWMRLLDDCVDDASGPQEAGQALEQWEKKTRELLADPAEAGDSGTLWPAFVDTVQRYNIPDGYFFEIIRGVRMDLTINSYQSFDELYEYCYCVASVVGLACLHVMGFTHAQAKKHGEWLGIAFQLTNILRDIKEDAGRGRIYLPADELQAFKINPNDILELRWSRELHDLVECYSYRAETYYLKAQPLFDMVLPDARPTLEIMSEIYGGILRRLREIHYDVFNHRAALTRRAKLMAVIRRRFAKRPAVPSGEAAAPDLSPGKIAIVGGGAAGLAAAVVLSEFGYEISVFEKKKMLGGKAAWFSDARRDEDLENPTHFWLTPHASSARFFSMVGARRLFELRSGWRVLAKNKVGTLRPSERLPFPFHWLPSLRRLGLGWQECRSIMQAMFRLARYDREEEIRLDRLTFRDWLRFHKQSENSVERFWKPFLSIGIPDRISRLSTCQVAFFLQQVAVSGPLGWYAPTVPAGGIYDGVCRWFLHSRHVEIRTDEDVKSVFYGNDQWNVQTGDGTTHTFDEVVVTLSRELVGQILQPKDYAVLTARAQFDQLGYVPSLLAQLEFRQPLFEASSYTLLNEAPFTWGIASPVAQASMTQAPFSVTLVGSDSRPYVFTENPQLLNNRLREIWENILGEGEAPVNTELWYGVDRNFASEPGSFAHRPSQETSLPGLWLAADWTKTGWPAGLEGSIDSGFRCAEKILEKRGWKIRLVPEA